jgi:GNAT superfamily N-acetyltransferase
MPSKLALLPDLVFYPVTVERWHDLQTLFGENGAYGNCWCMWWRLSRSDFGKQTGQEKKQGLKAIVDADEVPGILAYTGSEPIAWCSVAPREAFPSLERSRTLKRVDDQPVWSIVCFFVAKPFRHQGMMVKMLEAAVNYARKHGAKIVEGYPIEVRRKNLPPVSNFTGVVSAFSQAGFVEVERRSERRPIMRYFLEK